MNDKMLNRMISQALMPDIELRCLKALRIELKKLRNEVIQIHTMLQCSNCERGVQNQHSVLGMCPTCGEEELTRLRGIERACLGDLNTVAKDVVGSWRGKADDLEDDGFLWWPRVMRAIADALEATK